MFLVLRVWTILCTLAASSLQEEDTEVRSSDTHTHTHTHTQEEDVEMKEADGAEEKKEEVGLVYIFVLSYSFPLRLYKL